MGASPTCHTVASDMLVFCHPKYYAVLYCDIPDASKALVGRVWSISGKPSQRSATGWRGQADSPQRDPLVGSDQWSLTEVPHNRLEQVT